MNDTKRLNHLTFAECDERTPEERKWVHFCGEWDGLAITPACDEWECCSCYLSDVKKQKEDDFFKAFPAVKRPILMSGMYDDMSEEDMVRLVHNQEEHEAWALAQSFGEYCESVRAAEIQEEADLQERWSAQLQKEADDFSMLSLSAAELPDENWNKENG